MRSIKQAQVKVLQKYMLERHRVYERKKQGLPKPWTKDPMLQQYRFCNVYRELDTVTEWIQDNIMTPFAKDPNLFFMLCIARQINLPETLAELIKQSRNFGTWPNKRHGFVPEDLAQSMLERKARGKKVYTGAYMISCNWINSGWTGPKDKPYYTAHCTLGPLWEGYDYLMQRIKAGRSLEKAYNALMEAPGRGWGSFMCAQVLADAKHTDLLHGAPDYWSWAASGPGSRKGLNIICGEDVMKPWDEEEWLDVLTKLGRILDPWVEHNLPKRLCAQNRQNALCEFSKYWRGSSKSLYPGV